MSTSPRKHKRSSAASPRISKVSYFGRIKAALGQHIEQLSSSFFELWRTPVATLMTILVLGIALSLPTVFHVMYKNMERVTGQWDSASEVSLFLKKGISEERIQVLINKLGLYDSIETVTYISNHQALQEFKEISGFSKALDHLDENPLPAVLVVVPVKSAMNATGSKLLVAKLEREQDIDLVSVDIEWIEKLQAIFYLLVDVVIGIAALLLLSVLLIVSNTIRLNILNQRSEIEVLKLVGATNRFIQLPYIYIGAWYGFLGGVIAWLFSLLLVFWLHTSVITLTTIYQVQFEIISLTFNESMILVITGAVLGFVASFISVKQYLVQIEPK